ncbi:MAG TPA: glutamate-ammonia-ligase adenylyltransferase, partial [Pirellulales bacterium]|nr:glutamate-ammonia-ligase adenylyltransferase [Pirellulales bacterium]
FSFNPPTMNLYVELCASSPYLSGILTSNPGMIDELMDSLVLNKLPTRELLAQTMADVTRGAEDLDPILHSFKNTQQLRIGVRDILGKEDIRATMGALSDIAETCLVRIADSEYEKLTEKLGEPTIGAGPRAGQPCELTILALGKLGGRELNYHSDLDVVFLYEADGTTVHNRRGRKGETTNNQHFFSELGQRIIKTASRLGPYGRLFEIDPRLRPTGKSGALAMPLAEFMRYFTEGQGRLWERQALCKARVVYGSPEAAARALEAAHTAAYQIPFVAADAGGIAEMRHRLEASSHESNIKRGRGGLVDIEFLVQMFQLKFGRLDPSLRIPNTLLALEALYKAGHLSEPDFTFLTDSYRFLRTMEARLRLMSTTARDDLPDNPVELAKLAHVLGYHDPQPLVEKTREFRKHNRQRFEAILAAEG